jgi:16S rRNA U1498 N3-methylase RsmE
MQRFCTDIPLGEYIHISTTDMYHQICHVLRAAVGDMYIFFRGDGSADQVYSITDISKKVIIMKHIRGEIANIEPQLHISLYQALPNKHEKIEYILQK